MVLEKELMMIGYIVAYKSMVLPDPCELLFVLSCRC